MIKIAKDKVVISTKATLDVMKTSIGGWKFYKIDYDKSKYKKRRGFYDCVYKSDVGCYHIELLKGIGTIGLLTISFSISKAFNGSNALSKTILTEEEIHQKVEEDLSKYIRFDLLEPIGEWLISKDETYIDIIAQKDTINQLYNSISKTIISQKRVNLSMKKNGTIYFHSGKEWNNAGSIIKVYYKLKEISDNNRIEELGEVIKTIPYGFDVLRIECVSKRHKIKRELEKKESEYKALEKEFLISLNSKTLKFNCNKEDVVLENVYNKGPDIPPPINYNRMLINRHNLDKDNEMNIYNNLIGSKRGKVSDVIDIRYQYSNIFDMWRALALDKRKVTREKLFKIINESSKFSKTSKKTAIGVIKYVNGETDKIPISEKLFKRYLKDIGELGVHYIYTDEIVNPIHIEELIVAIKGEKRVEVA